MPIQVTCPSCNATLKTADSSAGKRAKCPKCAGVIQIPELPAPDGEYELEAPASPLGAFTDDELSSGPPTTEDRRPCPACGEMIPKKAIKCRFCGEVLDKSMTGVLASPGDVSDPGWQKVRAGLSTMYYCIITIFVVFVLFVLGAMIVAGAAAAGGGNFEGPLAIFAGVGMIVFVIVMFCAVIGMIVGQVRCTNVPESSGARVYAIGAAVCMIANIILSMIGGAMQSQAVNSIGSLISFIGYVLFILFIRRAATYLEDHELASSASRFLILGVVLFFGAIMAGVLAAVSGSGGVVAIFVLVAIVAGIVAFVWYLRLISSLMAAIDSRLRA